MNAVFATVALLLVAVATVSAYHDMEQVLILPLPQRNLQLGESCRVSSECISGCCAVTFAHGNQAGRARQCRRLAGPGERCSEGQIKGGTFVGGCPCRIGHCGYNRYCPQY